MSSLRCLLVAVCGLLVPLATSAAAGDKIKVENSLGFNTLMRPEFLRAYWESVKPAHKLSGKVSDHLTPEQIDTIVMLEANIAIAVDPRDPSRYPREEILAFMTQDARFATGPLPTGFDGDVQRRYLVAMFRTKEGAWGLITRYRQFTIVEWKRYVGVVPIAADDAAPPAEPTKP